MSEHATTDAVPSTELAVGIYRTVAIIRAAELRPDLAPVLRAILARRGTGGR